MKAWPERPKGLTERSYRKYMSRTKKVTVNGTEYTLQSVSPRWYFEQSDTYFSGNRKDTGGYIDVMLKNVVVSPPEITARGLDYFDEQEDIVTPEKLLSEIENFLRGKGQSGASAQKSKVE